MAHELDFSRGNGAAFLAVGDRQDVWHREGTYVAAAPDLASALTLAQLDFTVEKRPLVQLDAAGQIVRDAAGQPVVSRKAFHTVRTDTGRELGAVGPDYQPLQNADAFKVLTPLVDGGLVTFETAGALRNGEDVWLLTKFNIDRFGPVVREVFTGEIVPYGLFTNNHAGRRNAVVMETPTRVVCANTLGAAMTGIDATKEGKIAEKALAIRHTGDVEAKLVDAATSLWGAIIERYEVVAKQYRLLKGFYLDEALFRELVLDVAAPLPQNDPRFNPDGRLAPLVVARAEEKRTELSRLFTAGAGHTGDRSAWEAYNGVAEAVDHNTELWPLKAGSWRTAQLLYGTYGQIKQNVLDGLVRAARN